MFDEIPFEYPSFAFFEQIETSAKLLALSDPKVAQRHFKRSGSAYSEQSLSDLIRRLKVEIANDFQKYLAEDEVESLPYNLTYQVAVEKHRGTIYLAVSSILSSKHGHPGRILYGSSIYRIAEDTFVSESHYDD